MLWIRGANAFQSSASHSAYGQARHKKFAPGKIRWMASRPFAFRAHFNPAAGHALRRRGGSNDTSIRFFTSPVGMWIGVRLEPVEALAARRAGFFRSDIATTIVR